MKRSYNKRVLRRLLQTTLRLIHNYKTSLELHHYCLFTYLPTSLLPIYIPTYIITTYLHPLLPSYLLTYPPTEL